jgi:hypothetical protein
MTKKLQRIAERGAIVGQGAIDYITCSTYNGDQYALVVEMIDQLNVSRETITPKTARGYQTSSFGWASYGEGQQAGQPHFLINANGKEADALVTQMLKNPLFNLEAWNCSRLDIQLTAPKNRAIRLAHLGISLIAGQLGDYKGRGKPQARTIGSKTGDTLYIGSPNSQKMIRFYDKPLIHKRQREDFERYEIQYRDDYSNPLLAKLFKDRNKMDRGLLMRTLKREYDKLPDGLRMELSFWQVWGLEEGEPLAPDTTDKTESARLKWLKSLKRTLVAMASAQGPAGIEARSILLEAVVIGTTEEPLTGWMDYKLLSPEGEILDPLQ